MAMTSADTFQTPRRWVRLLIAWHVLLAMISLVGLAVFWTRLAQERSLWQQVLFTMALVLVAVFSAAAARQIGRQRHRGRVFSLVVNYLGFLFFFFATLYRLGFFDGLDGVADRFAGALPFLVAIFAGLVVSSGGTPTNNRRTIGRAITWLGLAAFLVTVGLLDGFWAAARGLVDPLNASFLAATLLFGAAAWAAWRRPVATYLGATNADAELLDGYLFLSPNLLGFLVFFAGPLLLSLYVSFTNSDAFGTADWIGLENYARIANLEVARLDSPGQRANEVLDVTIYSELNRFTILGRSYVVGAQDKLFWTALGNTLQFVLLAVPLSVIPALFLANLLNSRLPGMWFFRAVYFLPSVAAVVGIALVWQWLYNATIGYINYFITLGVRAVNFLGPGVVDPQIRWLSESSTALLAVIIMAAWQWIGFNTVLFLAGLQNIPRALYEAATVDGASPRAQFWRITLPLLAPTTFFVVTTTIIQAMQVFEQVFIIIPGQNPAGPQNSTLTMVLYLYQKGFQRFEQGYASAIAWVLFLLIFGATLFQFQRQRTSGATFDV